MRRRTGKRGRRAAGRWRDRPRRRRRPRRAARRRHARMAVCARSWRRGVRGLTRTRQWTPSTHLGGLVRRRSSGSATTSPCAGGSASTGRSSPSRSRSTTQLGVEALRAQAESALAGPAASSDPQARRAGADAARDPGVRSRRERRRRGQPDRRRRSRTSLTRSRADPSDTAAKFDLELLLRLTAAEGTRSSNGPANGFGRTGKHGAAGGAPGSGY